MHLRSPESIAPTGTRGVGFARCVGGWFLFVAMAMGNVACSGPSGNNAGAGPSRNSAGGAPLDACALIGAQRAGDILDAHVTTKPVGRVPTGPGDPSKCHYSTGVLHGGFLLNIERIHYTDARAAPVRGCTARSKTHCASSLPPRHA